MKEFSYLFGTNGDDYTIDHAEPSDLPIIRDMRKDMFNGMVEQHPAKYNREMRDIYLVDGCYLLKKGSECIGLLQLDTTSHHHNSLMYISAIYVKEEYRGNGLAKRLVREALEVLHVEGYKYVFLDVLANNEPAIKLYESLGFIPTTIQMFYGADLTK